MWDSTGPPLAITTRQGLRAGGDPQAVTVALARMPFS